MASGNVVLEPLVQTILFLWNKRGQPDLPLAEEVKQHRGLPEGATAQITINAYERNTKARKFVLTITDWIVAFVASTSRQFMVMRLRVSFIFIT